MKEEICPAGHIADPNTCTNTNCMFYSVLNSSCLFCKDVVECYIRDRETWENFVEKYRKMGITDSEGVNDV